jgi:putative transcriptional regulator
MPQRNNEQAIANKLLIAMPDQGDGFFEKSVVLMLEHNAQGAMGLTLTHASDMNMLALLDNLDMPLLNPQRDLSQPVMVGGPVQPDRGFILHHGKSRWENTARLSESLSLSVSLDFLKGVADDRVLEEYEVYLGYAGWGAGQLEQELRDNQWLFAEADPELIFDLPPEARWQAALQRLGIHSHQISRTAGHA